MNTEGKFVSPPQGVTGEMDGQGKKERPHITLERVTIADVEVLAVLKEKVTGLKTYSVTTDSEELASNIQKETIYFIKSEGAVAGDVAYEMKSEKEAYLSDLVIDPAYQGRGLGREALTLVLQELEEVERISLVTHPDNQNALALYLSFGFQITSREEDYYGDGEPRFVLVKIKNYE